jgi:DNA-binding transcriptional LysR family regulator
MLPIQQLNWDDVRVFLATMRASSLRQAAEDLGVSHPTAGRRLNALEERLGLTLFHRRSDGLHATPQAVELAEAAERVESAMLALGRVAQAADPELKGRVRVTLPGALATDLLMPDFVAFSQRWPQIDLEIISSSGIADLAQREADVAIRIMPMGKPPQQDLAGRKAATLYRAVYGFGDAWIGWRSGPVSLTAGQDGRFAHLPVRGILKDVALQRSACAAGMGLSLLPCFYAEPLLTRRTDPEPGGEAWVLVHPDLRRNPRLRVFRDAVVAAFKRHQPRLEGSPS